MDDDGARARRRQAAETTGTRTGGYIRIYIYIYIGATTTHTHIPSQPAHPPYHYSLLSRVGCLHTCTHRGLRHTRDARGAGRVTGGGRPEFGPSHW